MSKSLLLLAALLTLSATLHARQPHLAVQRMRQTRIDEVRLQQASLEDAVAFLRMAVEASHPDDQGVNIVITPPAADAAQSITLELNGVSAADTFAMILQLANCRAELRGDMILIHPRSP